MDAVLGRDGEGVGPAGARRRGAAERRRAVAVVDERHAAGQGADSVSAGPGPGGSDREVPAVPTVKVALLALVMAGAWVAWLTVVRVKFVGL